MRCGQTQHDDNRTLYSCLINYPLDCASSSCLVVTSRIGSSTASLLARATSSISPRKPAVGYEAYFNTFWRLQSRTSGPRQAGAIRRFLCQQALPSQELPTFCQSSLEICLTSPLTFPLSDLWAPTRDVILSATNYSQKAFNPHPNDDPCVIIEHECLGAKYTSRMEKIAARKPRFAPARGVLSKICVRLARGSFLLGTPLLLTEQ